MNLKICEYCGTEYNMNQTTCPLCGKNEQEAHKAALKNAGTAQKDEERIPRWMWMTTCVLLAVAVIVGIVYFLVSMEYVGGDGQPDEIVIQMPETEPPVEEPIPEPEEEEPLDLSCTALELSQQELVLDEQGGHVFLTAVPEPLGCSDIIFYSSADDTVATVDMGGMITAVGSGETVITVTCGDVTETCMVICDFVEEETEEPEEPDEPEETEQPEEPNEPEETEQPEENKPQLSLELNNTDFTLFARGEETTLKVTGAPEGAAITYTSGDPSVVTVTNEGKVTAVGNGTTRITVSVDGKTLECVARCNLSEDTPDAQLPAAGGYHLSHEDVTLNENSNESFTLMLLDQYGKVVSGAVFKSENSSVCTAEANGRITAVGKGVTTVTVTYAGQSFTCIVR